MSLHVLDAGLATLVVDMGRPQSRRFGVPIGGAADRLSLALGNALVGNEPNAAALEITLAGPTLQAEDDLACVVYGAPFDLGTDQRRLTTGTTFTLRAGERLFIRGTKFGARAYFCVRGGIHTDQVLGSRSAFQPLTTGTILDYTPGSISGRRLPELFDWAKTPTELRILPGLQTDWFPHESLSGQTFRVGPTSNRMGVRLLGDVIPVPRRELVSEAVSPGSVQVTSGGQCIVLGVDCQTIGGYPRIAQVIAADLDLVGQLRPGAEVCFREVDQATATIAWRQRQAELHEWLVRLSLASGEGHLPV